MASFLRHLSVLVFLSLLFAIALYLLLSREAGSDTHAAGLVALVSVAVLFTLPGVGVLLWVGARRGEIEVLSARVRRIAGGEAVSLDADREFSGEIGELASILEQWAAQVAGTRNRYEQDRAATSEILDAIGEGLLAIDAERRIVIGNRRFQAMFGIDGPVAGRKVLEVIRSVALANAFDRALEGAESSYRDTIGTGDDRRLLEVRVFPVRRASRIAAVALFIDVSKIERLEAIRREFVADFSHEVRTPLAGLRSAIESFDGALDPAQERSLREIVLRQLGRLERLTRDLSELNEIESGDLVLHVEPLELTALLVDVATDLQPLAPEGIEIVGGGVEILADRFRLEQVFSNLMDNAIKYGGSQGRIVVSVDREGEQAVVRVRDQGPGIAPAECERIFNRFYRVDRSRSEVAGSGLGLAITKHLVQLHGGVISAKSEPGKGSVFEVRLPVTAEHG